MATAARGKAKGGGALAAKRKPQRGGGTVIPFPGAVPPPPAPYVEPAATAKPSLLSRMFGSTPKPTPAPLAPGVYRDAFGRQTFVPAPSAPPGTWHWKAKPVTRGTTFQGRYYKPAEINSIARKPVGWISMAEWNLLVHAGIASRLDP